MEWKCFAQRTTSTREEGLLGIMPKYCEQVATFYEKIHLLEDYLMSLEVVLLVHIISSLVLMLAPLLLLQHIFMI